MRTTALLSEPDLVPAPHLESVSFLIICFLTPAPNRSSFSSNCGFCISVFQIQLEHDNQWFITLKLYHSLLNAIGIKPLEPGECPILLFGIKGYCWLQVWNLSKWVVERPSVGGGSVKMLPLLTLVYCWTILCEIIYRTVPLPSLLDSCFSPFPFTEATLGSIWPWFTSKSRLFLGRPPHQPFFFLN